MLFRSACEFARRLRIGSLSGSWHARWRRRVSLVALASGVLWCAPEMAIAGRAQRVAAGAAHTCAVTTSGGVECWGDNYDGQLGDGTTTTRTTPTDVSGLTSGVMTVATGGSHTCAVTTAGGVKCWGHNNVGQLGDGTTTSRTTPTVVSGLTSGVAAVVAGSGHTCALTTTGGVKCWGSNVSGRLGDGTTTQRTTPVDVTGLTSGVVAVAAGDSHTCAVTTGGGVKCWGENYQGQLGDGTTTQRTTPTDVFGLTSSMAAVTAGKWYTCALTAGGGVKCWGYNYDGQLGDGTRTNRITPVDVLGLASGVAVATGEFHTCALTTGGDVRCWGANDTGQLGDGTTTRQTTPTGVSTLASGVTVVATGGSHTCALTAGGGVTCWGSNSSGQMGDGTTSTRTMPTDVAGLTSGVTAVATGGSHTCALTAGGGAKCWGANYVGELGDGTYTSRTTPVDVTGLTSGVVALTASGHTCALTAEGGLKCWGPNGSGQLGDGTTTTRLTATDVSGLTSGVVAVATGGSHTCAVTTAGGLKCWGSNSYGQLGDGTTSTRTTPTDVSGLASGVTAVATGAIHTCAVTTAGGMKCWGQNWYGQLGTGGTVPHPTPTDVSGLASGVLAVAAGSYHTCAATTGGGVKCWGQNSDGRLGDGTTTIRMAPTDVMGLESGVLTVNAGGGHTCAVTSGGGLKCWGSNAQGQLGDPTSGPRVTPIRTRGFGQSDFDRDDRADVTVYRPSAGTWFSLDSSTHNSTYQHRGWGLEAQGDVPAPGDYDGDGLIDPTVFRPATGTWFILESHANYTTWDWFGWGSATDTLVPGDYDGDGKTDAAVYRASTGAWYIRPSSGATGWNVVFGQSGDEPISGDFDGDGKRDPAVYRAASGTWLWLKSSSNFTEYDYHGWGVQAQGDVPAPGDYDGDGKTDLCVFRPGTGTWFILESHTNFTTWNYFGWGTAGDQVVPADFDGDGKTDAAVYRASTGTWYVRPSGGASPWNVVFGQAGDSPLITIR